MARSKHPWRKFERNMNIYIQYETFGYPIRELAISYNVTENRVRQIIDQVHYRITHGDDEYVSYYDKLFS